MEKLSETKRFKDWEKKVGTKSELKHNYLVCDACGNSRYAIREIKEKFEAWCEYCERKVANVVLDEPQESV